MPADFACVEWEERAVISAPGCDAMGYSGTSGRRSSPFEAGADVYRSDYGGLLLADSVEKLR